MIFVTNVIQNGKSNKFSRQNSLQFCVFNYTTSVSEFVGSISNIFIIRPCFVDVGLQSIMRKLAFILLYLGDSKRNDIDFCGIIKAYLIYHCNHVSYTFFAFACGKQIAARLM